MKLSPASARIAILVIELMVFFMVTAMMTYFISYAGALQILPGETAPAPFPVIAYDGDPKQPDPKNYFVVPWTDWEAVASKRNAASLLLPERSRRIKLPDGSRAHFTSTPESDGRQAIELNWVNDDGERHVRYLARAQDIEPQYFRVVTTNTFLLGAAAGFIAGLFAGRNLRRRWLTQPGFYAPGAGKSGN
jgi:hypothetical protein